MQFQKSVVLSHHVIQVLHDRCSVQLRKINKRVIASKIGSVTTSAMVNKSREQVISEFRDAVNMGPDELAEFLQTHESNTVGQVKSGEKESVGHQSGKKIVEILKKDTDALDEDDVEHMQVSGGQRLKYILRFTIITAALWDARFPSSSWKALQLEGVSRVYDD